MSEPLFTLWFVLLNLGLFVMYAVDLDIWVLYSLHSGGPLTLNRWKKSAWQVDWLLYRVPAFKARHGSSAFKFQFVTFSPIKIRTYIYVSSSIDTSSLWKISYYTGRFFCLLSSFLTSSQVKSSQPHEEAFSRSLFKSNQIKLKGRKEKKRKEKKRKTNVGRR